MSVDQLLPIEIEISHSPLKEASMRKFAYRMITFKRFFALLAVFSTVVNSAAAPPSIQISPRPPKDLASRTASQTDLAIFAWQEFLALNWKASVDKTHPPSPLNQRGLPDLTWSYKKQAPAFPDPLVWQTYAQTTELRPNFPLTTPWRNLGIPAYSYQVPLAMGSPNAKLNLWNNLDEDNEIGSCDIYSHYTAQPSPKELVLFQVRVNKDEYEYIRLNFGKDQNVPPTPGPNPSSTPVPNTGGRLARAAYKVTQNITTPPYAYYGSKPVSTCNCPPDQAICLPCGVASSKSGLVTPEGTIEVKTAWRRLMPGDNPKHFFTTTAIYYDLNPQGQLAYYNDTFALVGMHIIHKTQNFPDFVFATFEQVEVENSDAQFISLAPPPLGTPLPTPTPMSGTELPPAVPIVRQTGQTNRQQMHPVPQALDDVTQQVQKQLASLNPTTVWQYYRLTGVSGPSTDCPVNLQGNPVSTANCINYQDAATCTTLNQNYYMANFLIESDPFLNNFSGPGFANAIFPGCQNTVYKNKIYDNGGCKGCHGVAQTAFGTDFSFLLDFGNNKPSIRPATIHYDAPGTVPAKPAPLKHFLDLVLPAVSKS
jgi:hypothetical protein